ncbi:hypothetical protein CPLU01_01571 [Colletotrichum plurivorum]|uniref:Uncharacterized protein n=1 Tax=Colletotrichum plurivorum TaxID=2175906 RepID=A0A8H6KXX7_9PEZI|nr:hypothetical protein CPLU01_01571 [Colletotrichum plurivorum]
MTRYTFRTTHLHKQGAQPAVLWAFFSLVRFTHYTCFPDDFTTPHATSLSRASAFGVFTHPAYNTQPSVQPYISKLLVPGTGNRKTTLQSRVYTFFSPWVDRISSPQQPRNEAIISDGI